MPDLFFYLFNLLNIIQYLFIYFVFFPWWSCSWGLQFCEQPCRVHSETRPRGPFPARLWWLASFNSIAVTDTCSGKVVYSAVFPFAVSARVRSMTTTAIVPYCGIVLRTPSKGHRKVIICVVTVEAKIVVKLFYCCCCWFHFRQSLKSSTGTYVFSDGNTPKVNSPHFLAKALAKVEVAIKFKLLNFIYLILLLIDSIIVCNHIVFMSHNFFILFYY